MHLHVIEGRKYFHQLNPIISKGKRPFLIDVILISIL